MLYLAVICGLLVALQAWTMVDRRAERREAVAERDRLLSEAWQRITAPEYAAVQHYNDHVENTSPPAIEPDVDEDHWITKEDLARVAAQEELAGG